MESVVIYPGCIFFFFPSSIHFIGGSGKSTEGSLYCCTILSRFNGQNFWDFSSLSFSLFASEINKRTLSENVRERERERERENKKPCDHSRRFGTLRVKLFPPPQDLFHSTISEKERERDTERLGLNDNKWLLLFSFLSLFNRLNWVPTRRYFVMKLLINHSSRIFPLLRVRSAQLDDWEVIRFDRLRGKELICCCCLLCWLDSSWLGCICGDWKCATEKNERERYATATSNRTRKRKRDESKENEGIDYDC